eukprot:14749702-Alexandrium_andersonii.AAC.1
MLRWQRNAATCDGQRPRGPVSSTRQHSGLRTLRTGNSKRNVPCAHCTHMCPATGDHATCTTNKKQPACATMLDFRTAQRLADSLWIPDAHVPHPAAP